MNIIKIEQIKIAPDRQRKSFPEDKLHELADSIATRGLLQAIVLRKVADEFHLVAGERRLRAITDLGALGQEFHYDGNLISPGYIPYTLLSDLSPLAAEEAELEENIRRVDLTWQERAAAHERLSRLRTAQAVQRGEAPPTVAAIAVEVRGSSEGVNQETTRRELIVAKHLDKPEVRAAKNVDEAFKILRKTEEAQKNRELGARVGATYSAAVHSVINADATEWLAACPADQFDVILTDPPYGMGADEFGDSGGVAAGAHGYSDSEEVFDRCAAALYLHSYRIAKPQAHLYWFCDIDAFHSIAANLREAGWWVFRTPLLWLKKSGMRAPWPEHGPQRKYETLVYAVKGKRPVMKMGGDVLDFPPDANLGHAAQKPVALFQELLSRSCRPGDTVLDPFMGSGPILAAAHALKLRATGVELDQASYGIAVKRLEGLSAQAELDVTLGV